MKKAGRTLPKDWEREKDVARPKGAVRRGSENWPDEPALQAATSTFASTPAFSNPSVVIAPSHSSGSPLSRKRWEIRSGEVQRDGEKLGQGGFGAVYKGTWRGMKVAIKQLLDDSDESIEQFKKEIETMSELRHPNVVLFLGACLEPGNVFFITEFVANGNLHEMVAEHKPQWVKRLQFARDIARGMTYLHENDPTILHRDLKSLNVLIDENYVAKVADFGLSKESNKTAGVTVGDVGTVNWTAPELMDGGKASKAADVYAYGVVLWEILVGEFPFADQTTFQVIKALSNGERPSIPRSADPEYARLITDCWQQDPARRPTFMECLSRLEAMYEKARTLADPADLMLATWPRGQVASSTSSSNKVSTSYASDPNATRGNSKLLSPKQRSRETSPRRRGTSQSDGSSSHTTTDSSFRTVPYSLLRPPSVEGSLSSDGSDDDLYDDEVGRAHTTMAGHSRSRSADASKRAERDRDRDRSRERDRDREHRDRERDREHRERERDHRDSGRDRDREERKKASSTSRDRDRERDRDRDRDRERDRDRRDKDRESRSRKGSRDDSGSSNRSREAQKRKPTDTGYLEDLFNM